MDDIKKINQRIKDLECDRYRTIKEFIKLSDLDKMNYDLGGVNIIAELEKYLKQINELGYKLCELYDIKNLLEK